MALNLNFYLLRDCVNKTCQTLLFKWTCADSRVSGFHVVSGFNLNVAKPNQLKLIKRLKRSHVVTIPWCQVCRGQCQNSSPCSSKVDGGSSIKDDQFQ